MFSVYTDYNTLNRKINRDFKKPLLAFDEIYGSAAEAEQKEFMQAFIERIDLYPVLYALKRLLNQAVEKSFRAHKKDRQLFA